MNSVNLNLANFLQLEVAPIASECDIDFATLNNLFNRMGELGLYALSVHAQMEGVPLCVEAMFDNKAAETKASGALSFLTSQINLSTRLIYEGQNDSLKQDLLPKIFRGELRIANAVSHLRSKPVFAVEATKGGYFVSGEIYWLTGFNHFEQFVFGFKHNNKEYFAVLPFCNTESGTLCISEVLPVMVMQSTQTVRATLKNYFIADEWVLSSQAEGTWNEQMRQNTAILAYFYGLGIGSLEILDSTCDNRQIFAIFQERLQQLRAVILKQNQHDYTQLRVELTYCVWQCIQCAIISSKGKAIDPNSPISRIYREFVQFNALAALPDYIDAQLAHIIQLKTVPYKF